MQSIIRGMGEKVTGAEDSFIKEHSLRAKYFSLRNKAADLDSRTDAFNQMSKILIHETNYEFDPDKFLVDRKIPKGGILQALRDSCKE